MKKSTVIAKCLVNSDMVRELADAERAVQDIFLDEFPNAVFTEWNQHINDETAEHIIQGVGRASQINVREFIQDLW